jgi:hypothetical protein
LGQLSRSLNSQVQFSLLWGLLRSAKIGGIEPPRLVALHSKSMLMKLASIVADYREFIRRETSSLQMGMTA